MSKTHCKYGHERSPDNVSRWGNCITCQRNYQKQYRRDRPKTGNHGGGNANSGRGLSTERKALLDAAVKDGWPLRQIIATYGFGTSTIKRHHPDYTGMSQRDSIVLSLASRRLNQKLGRAA